MACKFRYIRANKLNRQSNQDSASMWGTVLVTAIAEDRVVLSQTTTSFLNTKLKEFDLLNMRAG